MLGILKHSVVSGAHTLYDRKCELINPVFVALVGTEGCKHTYRKAASVEGGLGWCPIALQAI